VGHIALCAVVVSEQELQGIQQEASERLAAAERKVGGCCCCFVVCLEHVSSSWSCLAGCQVVLLTKDRNAVTRAAVLLTTAAAAVGLHAAAARCLC
jgi:hypothetical protein